MRTMPAMLLISVSAISTIACSEASGMDLEALTGLLREARNELDMPGLRAAVRLVDGRVVRAAVGLADVEASMPLNGTMPMPGGSTGKSFVAALTMLLVEDGALSLDDRAAKWLGKTSWYSRLPNADTIRLCHLLAHTSGIADYPEAARYQIAMIWRALFKGGIRFDPEELIGYVLDRKPPFPAGDGYHYTDVGYLVLGRLIESATGRGYFDLLKERILIPQNLDEVVIADRSIIPNVATGYSRGARNLKKDGRMKFDPTSEWTGGGLATNPTMLVQFFAALAEGHIVKPDSLSLMLNAGWRNPEDPGSRYGFGLFVFDNGKSFGNAGMWPGYRTHVTHYVTTGITVAVQTNRDGPIDMGAIVERIARLPH